MHCFAASFWTTPSCRNILVCFKLKCLLYSRLIHKNQVPTGKVFISLFFISCFVNIRQILTRICTQCCIHRGRHRRETDRQYEYKDTEPQAFVRRQSCSRSHTHAHTAVFAQKQADSHSDMVRSWISSSSHSWYHYL